MKAYVLKVVAITAALFIAYLWSGGAWQYHNNNDYQFKSNKITGTTYVLYDGEWKRINYGGYLKK